MIDLSPLQQALVASRALVEKAEDRALMASLGPVLQGGIQAGVIQHFEFGYELCWKLLKRRLEQDAASATAIDALSFKDLIRVGAERGFIRDPEAWFAYRLNRNLTSHIYNKARADAVYATALRFFDDAQNLLDRLSARGGDVA